MLKSLTSIFNGKLMSTPAKFKTKPIATPTQNLSDNTISLHNQALSELRIFGLMMKALDDPEFERPDFIFYLRFKSHLKNQYKDLKDVAELLRIFVQAKDSLLKIKQIQLRYHNPQQKEYYDFIDQLLENNLDNLNLNSDTINNDKHLLIDFKTKIKEKLDTTIAKVKNEQDKKPLEQYLSCVQLLASEKKFGLKVLYILQKSQFQLTDFALLKTIILMVNDLQNKNLKNRSKMLTLVKEKKEVFQKIGNLLGLSGYQLHEENYAILLQYLCLSKIHSLAYDKYANLIEILAEWEKFYKVVTHIRQQYPLTQFKTPKDFNREIVGLDIYQKYKYHLNE